MVHQQQRAEGRPGDRAFQVHHEFDVGLETEREVRGNIVAVSRGPAIWATAVALALLNAGLAALIVLAVGAPSFAPLWVGALLVLAGAAAAWGAFVLWRRYLANAREF